MRRTLFFYIVLVKSSSSYRSPVLYHALGEESNNKQFFGDINLVVSLVLPKMGLSNQPKFHRADQGHRQINLWNIKSSFIKTPLVPSTRWTLSSNPSSLSSSFMVCCREGFQLQAVPQWDGSFSLTPNYERVKL